MLDEFKKKNLSLTLELNLEHKLLNFMIGFDVTTSDMSPLSIQKT